MGKQIENEVDTAGYVEVHRREHLARDFEASRSMKEQWRIKWKRKWKMEWRLLFRV